MNMKIKNKMAVALGRLSAAKRHEGKSEEWISRYYKKLRAKRKHETNNSKRG